MVENEWWEVGVARGQYYTQPNVPKKASEDIRGEQGRQGIQNSNVYPFCCHLSEEHMLTGISWYLIRNIQDLICCFVGSVFSTGPGERDPTPITSPSVSHSLWFSFFESRMLCVRKSEIYKPMCPPFLYNNYITYAFIHYELISASQREHNPKKETINHRMWP